MIRKTSEMKEISENTVVIWYIFRKNGTLFQIYQPTLIWFKENWETIRDKISLVFDLYTERLSDEGAACTVQANFAAKEKDSLTHTKNFASSIKKNRFLDS